MDLLNLFYELFVLWCYGSILSAIVILYERKSLEFIKERSGWLDAILFFLVFAIGSFVSIGAYFSLSEVNVRKDR